MRHRKSGVKLNRTTSHRDAMFRNMVTSLLKHERIRTTDTKAKELRKWADHIITLAKRGDLHARRQALSIVREKDVVHKIFAEAADRFGSTNGGYTRIVKIGRRPGDSAPISLIELVSAGDGAKKDKKKSKKKKKTETTAAPSVSKQEEPTPVESAMEDSSAEAASTAAAQETAEGATAQPEAASASEAADNASQDSADEGDSETLSESQEDSGAGKDADSDKTA